MARTAKMPLAFFCIHFNSILPMDATASLGGLFTAVCNDET
jgi:hypothetical protein